MLQTHVVERHAGGCHDKRQWECERAERGTDDHHRAFGRHQLCLVIVCDVNRRGHRRAAAAAAAPPDDECAQVTLTLVPGSLSFTEVEVTLIDQASGDTLGCASTRQNRADIRQTNLR